MHIQILSLRTSDVALFCDQRRSESWRSHASTAGHMGAPELNQHNKRSHETSMVSNSYDVIRVSRVSSALPILHKSFPRHLKLSRLGNPNR